MIDLTPCAPRGWLARLFRTANTTTGVRLAVGMSPRPTDTFWTEEERYGRPETPEGGLNR
jgi:hypothetical protein